MYTGIKHLHSFWAYLVVALLFVATFNFLIKGLTKKSFTSTDKKLSLFTLIATHLQFVFGLVLYFISPLVKNYRTTGNFMQDDTARFYVVEHISVMILAVIFVTIGHSRAKKTVDTKKKFKTLTLFFLLALVLVLSRIPWNVWPNFMV